jgi:hypothetical protein
MKDVKPQQTRLGRASWFTPTTLFKAAALLNAVVTPPFLEIQTHPSPLAETLN